MSPLRLRQHSRQGGYSIVPSAAVVGDIGVYPVKHGGQIVRPLRVAFLRREIDQLVVMASAPLCFMRRLGFVPTSVLLPLQAKIWRHK